MVINMKSSHDVEIPLEDFFTGKWLADHSCLIPATEFFEPEKIKTRSTFKHSCTLSKEYQEKPVKTVASERNLKKRTSKKEKKSTEARSQSLSVDSDEEGSNAGLKHKVSKTSSSGSTSDSQAPLLRKSNRSKKQNSILPLENDKKQESKLKEEVVLKTSELPAVSVKRRKRLKKEESQTMHTDNSSVEKNVKRRGNPKKEERGRHSSNSSVEREGIANNKAKALKRKGSGNVHSSTSQSLPSSGKTTFSRSGRLISVYSYASDDSDVSKSDDESWLESVKKHKKMRGREEKVKKVSNRNKTGKKKDDNATKAQTRDTVVTEPNQCSHKDEEPLKPEDCQMTAKRGTLKYLQQREKFINAVMKETEVEDDFFSSQSPNKFVPEKKEFLNKLLASSSLDDSLTIKTPQGKGKKVSSNIITPRTMKLGEWANETPFTKTVTPSTNSSVPESEKKDALEVIYHHMKGRKRWTQPIRKMQNDRSLSQSILCKQTQLLELPELPEIPEGQDGESSDDDYFNTSDAY